MTETRPSRAWWWIIAACVLHVGAWVGWLAFSGRHPVREVPLAVPAGRSVPQRAPGAP